MAFGVGPGDSRLFDPVALVQGTGPCGSLAWVATWRATEPLTSAFVQQGTRTEIGRGRWGSASLGCSSLELRSDGAAAADVELVYTIASTR
ncbi:MAG TPA: hypothetical protein VFC31_13130 [Candidatus Limnocylindria bacterium]|nr:hypothetical protein [Candidatus Limnocylindria bacterium]